ncbi:hypothetical protein Droror1_Dr00002236, partial [Drosera rotundifolia]
GVELLAVLACGGVGSCLVDFKGNCSRCRCPELGLIRSCGAVVRGVLLSFVVFIVRILRPWWYWTRPVRKTRLVAKLLLSGSPGARRVDLTSWSSIVQGAAGCGFEVAWC